ncbi:subtilisin-like serine-protease S [Juglans microcarpa x Juglans regia]|uniref:subtilisin-like serine-protease S n=1 Tax=Juglans microcarpa x Juglans regia TaxID=2249226 RepID=UPI001B7F6FB0|nr:subtilisin-like serine-protease S [Juglans microcarpa x Juglans regia]
MNFLQGHGYNLYNLDGEYELVSAYFAGQPGVSNDQAGYCYRDALNPSLVKGKIVVYAMNGNDDTTSKSRVVRDLGGVGMVLSAVGETDGLIYKFDIPTSVITARQDSPHSTPTFVAQRLQLLAFYQIAMRFKRYVVPRWLAFLRGDQSQFRLTSLSLTLQLQE